jgi:hypothetical protein
LDTQLNLATPEFSKKIELAKMWCIPLKQAQNKQAVNPPQVSISTNYTSASALKPTYGSSFNSVHGNNSAEFLTDFISKGFNMDGKNPEGAKVGLLDAQSVWCFMVDPFTEQLKFNIEIKGGVAQACNRMIKKLVIGDVEMFATNCPSLLLQLNQYCTRQGDWKNVFELDRVRLSLDNANRKSCACPMYRRGLTKLVSLKAVFHILVVRE